MVTKRYHRVNRATGAINLSRGPTIEGQNVISGTVKYNHTAWSSRWVNNKNAEGVKHPRTPSTIHDGVNWRRIPEFWLRFGEGSGLEANSGRRSGKVLWRWGHGRNRNNSKFRCRCGRIRQKENLALPCYVKLKSGIPAVPYRVSLTIFIDIHAVKRESITAIFT